ncbi:MAG: VWA domain-containing protein [Vicinamibacterales bacterium]
MRRLASAGVVAMLAAAVLTAAQDPQVFRGGGVTVAVPVTVFDRGGHVVSGLTKDDFTLYDEGTPQAISNFIESDEALTAVVLVDTSASMTMGLELAQFAAEQFVIRMRPGDRAKVGSFSDRLILSHTFTQDRDALLHSIRNDLHIGNPTRLLDAVDSAVATLAPERGRRIILLLTDGCDTLSDTRWSRLLTRVRTEEVMIYAMQIRSHVRILPEYRKRNPRDWDCVNLEEQFMTAPAIEKIGDIFEDARHELLPDAVLERLTLETGGSRFFLSPDDNVNSIFTQFLEELRHVYLLGFVPGTLDDKLHELKVEVAGQRKDGRGRVVRARRSYLANKPGEAGGPTRR